MELSARYRGCLLGLAIGDAVGTALEFQAPGTFQPLTDMVGGGPFRLKPGQWTDDTSMAMCLAESLLECGGFDPIDQLRRYVRWWREGHWSSTGRCFDIGNTTRAALQEFEETGRPYCGSSSVRSAGNGSIMRLAPVALFYARRRDVAVARAGESSRTTHGARAAVDGARYLAALLVGLLEGRSKSELADPDSVGTWRGDEALVPEIDEIRRGSYLRRRPPEIRGGGYVVETLEAALWAFHSTESFRDGCLRVVNLGEDADTTGAVFGQLAGACYGEAGLPAAWRERVHLHDRIAQIADDLLRCRA